MFVSGRIYTVIEEFHRLLLLPSLLLKPCGWFEAQNGYYLTFSTQASGMGKNGVVDVMESKDP